LNTIVYFPPGKKSRLTMTHYTPTRCVILAHHHIFNFSILMFLPMHCDRPFSSVCMFNVLTCAMVLAHCVLQHQRSGTLSLPSVVHPKPNHGFISEASQSPFVSICF